MTGTLSLVRQYLSDVTMVCTCLRRLLLTLLLLATCAASSIKGTDSQLTHSLMQRSAPEEVSHSLIIA